MQVADEHVRGILSNAAKSMEESPDLLAALNKGKHMHWKMTSTSRLSSANPAMLLLPKSYLNDVNKCQQLVLKNFLL